VTTVRSSSPLEDIFWLHVGYNNQPSRPCCASPSPAATPRSSSSTHTQTSLWWLRDPTAQAFSTIARAERLDDRAELAELVHAVVRAHARAGVGIRLQVSSPEQQQRRDRTRCR
jgi:hypothetical protein